MTTTTTAHDKKNDSTAGKADAHKSDQSKSDQSTLAAAQESVGYAAEATRKAVGDATTKTVDAAKGNPKTAAAIAVGAVAALGAAAYGASKLLKSDETAEGETKTTKSKA